MCLFFLIWCLIRGFGFTNQSSRESEEEIVQKTKRNQSICKTLQNVRGCCLENLAVRACGQPSTLLSSCGVSAPEVQNTQTYSMKCTFIHVNKEPNNSLFAFSLYFCVFWVSVPCIFFSGSHCCVSPGVASSLPRALVAFCTLRWDSTATGAWGSCLHKGTGALGFLLNLSYESSCYSI